MNKSICWQITFRAKSFERRIPHWKVSPKSYYAIFFSARSVNIVRHLSRGTCTPAILIAYISSIWIWCKTLYRNQRYNKMPLQRGYFFLVLKFHSREDRTMCKPKGWFCFLFSPEMISLVWCWTIIY